MQKLVDDFNNQKNAHKKTMPVSARILDIQSELGELAKEYLKSTKYGTQENNKISSDFEMEFGDVLYSLLSLASETNINAEKALKLVIEKYRNRLNLSNQMGSDF